jgi:hypothetical protein
LPLLVAAILFFFRSGWEMPATTGSLDFSSKIKWLLDNIPFSLRVTISMAVIVFLGSLALFLYRRMPRPYLVLTLVIVDMAIQCWMNLPYSGIQTKSPGSMQALISEVPAGIPIPTLAPLSLNTKPEVNNIIGCWSYYSKQPGTPEYCDYPTVFSSTHHYFNSAYFLHPTDRPYVYLEKSGQPVKTLAFRNSAMAYEINNTAPDLLVLLQNGHPNWAAYAEGKKINIVPYQEAFMAVELPAGKHRVEFVFSPIKLRLVLEAWGILLIILAIAYRYSNKIRFSSLSLP